MEPPPLALNATSAAATSADVGGDERVLERRTRRRAAPLRIAWVDANGTAHDYGSVGAGADGGAAATVGHAGSSRTARRDTRRYRVSEREASRPSSGEDKRRARAAAHAGGRRCVGPSERCGSAPPRGACAARMDASALASLSIAAAAVVDVRACSLAPLKIADHEAVVAKVLGCADTSSRALPLRARRPVRGVLRVVGVPRRGGRGGGPAPRAHAAGPLVATARAARAAAVPRDGRGAVLSRLCRDRGAATGRAVPGVAHVLEALAAAEPGDVRARAHECLAELAEHDGAGSAARAHWEVAAAAGSE